jgi:hypothetical protein
MPRFVILEHDHPTLHWDLMLEAGPVLWTWRLPRLPQPDDVLVAERIADHRMAYLDYEGPISEGRGSVVRREWGDFEFEIQGPDELQARLNGVTLRCVLHLTRTADGAWHAMFA